LHVSDAGRKAVQPVPRYNDIHIMNNQLLRIPGCTDQTLVLHTRVWLHQTTPPPSLCSTVLNWKPNALLMPCFCRNQWP